MLLRLGQPEKALSPIFVTDVGTVMLVRFEQPEKAFCIISETPSHITKVFNFDICCAINVGPLALERLLQSKKACSPISVTDVGMEMLVRLSQP
jgi:hypothetical protein